MKLYRPRPIRAIRFTRGHLQEILSTLGEEVVVVHHTPDDNEPWLELRTQNGIVTLALGQWILVDSDKKIWTMDHDSFELKYEEG